MNEAGEFDMGNVSGGANDAFEIPYCLGANRVSEQDKGHQGEEMGKQVCTYAVG